MRWNLTPAAWILGAIFVTQCALAEEPTTRPALVGTHDTSLAGMIKFPRVKGDRKLAVRCQAKIDGEGTILTNACFNRQAEFQRAILKASRKATFRPATLDGKPTPVYIEYTVLFVKQGDKKDVVLIPNHSVNGKEFGVGYVAPQRIVRGIEGEVPCADKTYFNTISGSVGTDGTISNVELGWDDDRCPECNQCMLDVARQSRFIPGYTGDGPAAMKFEEPIFKLAGPPKWFWRRSSKEGVNNVPE